ncbi:hypothetical protein KUCAC02_005831, partial [Chaenocephalus aceratus]
DEGFESSASSSVVGGPGGTRPPVNQNVSLLDSNQEELTALTADNQQTHCPHWEGDSGPVDPNGTAGHVWNPDTIDYESLSGATQMALLSSPSSGLVPLRPQRWSVSGAMKNRRTRECMVFLQER